MCSIYYFFSCRAAIYSKLCVEHARRGVSSSIRKRAKLAVIPAQYRDVYFVVLMHA